MNIETGLAYRLGNEDDCDCVGRPVWSPDGRSIAFLGAAWPKSWDLFDVYVMAADGSELSNLTEGQPLTPGGYLYGRFAQSELTASVLDGAFNHRLQRNRPWPRQLAGGETTAKRGRFVLGY
jgi:hypothetical protein